MINQMIKQTQFNHIKSNIFVKFVLKCDYKHVKMVTVSQRAYKMLNQSRITLIWGGSNVPLFNWLSCNPVSLKTALSFHSSQSLLHSLSSNLSTLSFLALKLLSLFFWSMSHIFNALIILPQSYLYFSSSLLSPPPVLSLPLCPVRRSHWVCNHLVTVCQSASELTICPLGFRLELQTRTQARINTVHIHRLTVEPDSFTPQYDDSCISRLLTWAVKRVVTNITQNDISHKPRGGYSTQAWL